MRTFLLLHVCVAMTIVAAGCSCASETMTPDGGPLPDVGLDGARVDAGHDGGGVDGNVDAFALPDGHVEENPGPLVDMGIDAPITLDDAGSDGGSDAGTDAPITLPDTGVDAGGCTRDRDCASTEFCEFPTGACSGVGTCIARGIGRLCTALCAPQCGCDGATYQNECHRHQAGTSLASDGPCPGDPPPCGATCGCASDGDCPGTNKECVQTRTGGVCEDTVPRPMCWRDSDCTGSQTCVGANVCGCGMLCIIADRPGTCG